MDEQGPFDSILHSAPAAPQRDRAALVVVVATVFLGVLLLILVLPPISIFGGGGGSPGHVSTTMSDQLPAPPDGFEAVSPLYDVSSEKPVREKMPVTLSLTVPVAQDAELFLYSFENDNWRKLGDAEVVADGTAAQGEVSKLPSSLAVMQAFTETRSVVGNIASGAQPDANALPQLSSLQLTGFAPADDGSIAGEDPAVPEGVNVPVVATIGAADQGQIEIVNTILGSQELRDAHAQAILEFAGQHNLAGVNLDYRNVSVGQGEDVVAFLTTVSQGLHGQQRTLALTLPVPAKQADGSWDTHGFDWQALAPLADTLQLAPGVDPDQYYARMDDALSYLVPRVGGRKLLLPVGPLSRERGSDGVRTLKLTEALALASTPALGSDASVTADASVALVGQNISTDRGASAPQWDDGARAVTYQYTGGGGARTVWLANAFSEAFKLDLAQRYQLGGVVVEDVSGDTSDAAIWPAVSEYVQAGAIDLVKPNGQLLEPRWTASGGTFDADTGAQVTWHTPPEPGDYTVTLIVSDGQARVGQELQVTVGAAAAAP